MENKFSTLKRVCAAIVLIFLIGTCDASQAIANTVENDSYKVDDDSQIGELSGYLLGNTAFLESLYKDRKFILDGGRQKHGFAAEVCNNLLDNLSGENATVVGNDFAKNGADRVISYPDGTNILIQDKYCKSAADSVGAAFDSADGMYRYTTVDSDGNVSCMQLEVPYDQYDDAVKLMREEIQKGNVPGITDPDEASSIVRKGKLTYKQAVNLAKAGTVESLTYDAKNGVVCAGCSFGISFVMDFAWQMLNGVDFEYSIKNAALSGLKAGAVTFATVVISEQLCRTGLVDVLAPTTDAIAEALGPNVCRAIVEQVSGSTVASTTETIVANASKIIASNIIIDVVTVLIITGVDAVELWQGRISKEQFLQNLVVAVSGVGAGALGALAGTAIGSAISPGIGSLIGGVIGGIVGGAGGSIVSSAIIGKYFESDSEKMYEIVSEEFSLLSEDYLVTQEEAESIADQLKNVLSGDTLKDMYQSEDREEFARELIEPLFEEEVSKREVVDMPTDEEIRYEYMQSLQGIIFIH